MRTFAIQLTKTAASDLDSIPVAPRRKITEDIKFLYTNPFLFGGNIKKLRGFKPPLYRLRSGDYRVLYRVKDEMVTVIRIIDRKDLERIIKKFRWLHG